MNPHLFGRLLFLGVVLQAAVSHAQVTTTITSSGLGTTVTQAGTTYNITGGTRHGSNLFHSLGLFNVGAGDVADFNNETGLATSNILGRVTGGQPSNIFGTIRTSNFGTANLFLINPAGWIFGSTASLDVGGAFHVSTANYVLLGDGVRFNATPGPADALLTSAPPAAFGFLGPTVAPISIEGSFLQVPEGQTLSVVGGDIQITGATLTAPSGRVQIASVASAGEVTIPDLNVDSFANLGRIDILSSFINANDVSGIGGGTVVIRGGRLFADASQITADTVGDVDGAALGIELSLAEDINLTNGTFVGTTTGPFGFGLGRGGDVQVTARDAQIDGSLVTTFTFGEGNAGGVSLDVATLAVTGGAAVGSLSLGSGRGGDVDVTATERVSISGRDSVGTPSSLFSETQVSGDGGRLAISAPSLTMDDGGLITSTTLGTGPGGEIAVAVEKLSLTRGAIIQSNTGSIAQGGNVTVTATDSAVISGVGSDGSPGGIFSSSFGDGRPGDITVEAGTFTLKEGALIQGGTIFNPQGGTVTVTARDSIVIAKGSGISTQASSQDVGQVAISAPSLVVDNGFISTSTLGTGRAGDILADVGMLTLKRGGQITSNSELLATGAGGNVTITANSISISGTSPNGVPSAPFNTDPHSGIFSTAAGTGAGGNIGIQAGNVNLANGGIISAQSSGSAAALAGQPGNAGSVNIVVGDTLRMSGGTITTAAAEAAGGDITITHTGSLLHLTNSQIATSVNGGDGQGGNITIGAELDPVNLVPQNINPFDFIVLNNSGIHANAFGGPGGNINIFADLFLSSLPITTAVTASSALSTPGTIDIQATIADVSGDVSQLPEAPLQATELLRASCTARLAGGKSSSLVLAGRGGLPFEPGGLLPSPLYLGVDSAISSGSHRLLGEKLASSHSQFSLFGSSNERVQLGMGWDQFQLAKAALGFGCSQ